MNLSYGWGKGMKLKSPEGTNTRPTSAKAREAVMNILQNEISQGIFIDFFAGSGAMGIDALSRGATGAVFIENSNAALKALRVNIKEAERRAQNSGDIFTNIHILPIDASKAISNLEKFNKQVSVIWADPPYDLTVNWIEKQIPAIAEIMGNESILAIECRKKDMESIKNLFQQLDSQNLILNKEKNYGDTSVLFLHKAQ